MSPIAHLASNANQSTIPVVSGLSVAQIVPTKEVAACWAANDNGEACITNPGKHDGFVRAPRIGSLHQLHQRSGQPSNQFPLGTATATGTMLLPPQ